MSALPKYLPPILKQIAEKKCFTNFLTDIGSGTNIDDTLVGELLTAEISGEQRQRDGHEIDAKLNLLCKVAPANSQQRKESMADLLFKRESYFYNTVAPAFIHFQQAKGLPEEDQFKAFPRCYEAVCDQEKEVFAIVMEDLRPKGFAMWPMQKPVPPAQCRLFVRELAKFHAISFAMKDQQPEKFEEYRNLDDLLPALNSTSDSINLLRNSYKRAIEALESEEHKQIMRDIEARILEYFESCLGKNATEAFGVVSHGDTWNNNILYRTNSQLGTVEEVCFVDWQLLSYTSPAIDLLYYLTGATDKKTRDEKLGNLFREYHERLSSNIRKMGSDPEKLFPYEAFKKELKLCGNIAFLISPTTIEYSLDDAEDSSDVETTDGSNSIRKFSETAQLAYHKRINECIGDLVEHGYFRKLNN